MQIIVKDSNNQTNTGSFESIPLMEYNEVGNLACRKKGDYKMASPITVNASLQKDHGFWVVRGRVFNPETGMKEQRSKTTKLPVKGNNKRKAEARMDEIKKEWTDDANRVNNSGGPVFSVYVQRWLKRKVAQRTKANTIKSYEDYNKKHIQPRLGGIPIREITLSRIEDFYSEYLQTHAVNSARKVHVVITGAFQEAVLLDAVKAEGEPIRAAVTLAVCYGLRRSEALGLRWKDIDFELGTLTVSNTLVQNGELRIEAEETKTKKSHRTISLIPVTIQYLQELKKKQEEAGLDTDKVCTWPNGNSVRPDYITRKTQKIMAACALPVIRFHDLRHTAATMLAPHVTPTQLQEFLGHEDISTTLGIYTHILDEQRKETSRTMGSLLEKAAILF